MQSANYIDHKGAKAVELVSGGYRAIVVPGLGSNVVRFRDEKRGIEVFRYDNGVSLSEIMNSAEIWGLPTLYLPNRFDKGILRTSDAVYRLPVNEARFGNHIHGFVHKRAYTVKDMGTTGKTAFVENEYVYDERDFFYNCFPVKFTIRIRIELSDKGLKHIVTLINDSDRMLPVSFATHTTINAPFVDGGRQEDVRLTIPALERIPFNKSRWLPTGRRAKLSAYDKKYTKGVCPVLCDICNDMYSGGTTEIDGKPFRGAVMTDIASGRQILNEVDDKYRFWIIWNHEGFMNYFCPEPMTAQVNAPNMDMDPSLTGYEELAPGKTYTCVQRFITRG
ncbi:MAG: aldose 1-epimerase [Oscillospiraceae bacterium]|nr:aldose 1-epimerase [Oscillospiraceae bacterium]